MRLLTFARLTRGFLSGLSLLADMVTRRSSGGLAEAIRGRAPPLTGKDTIVLADFTNTTGDAVFDDTLKQALAIQLEQSPFLSLVSDERIQQTLRTMGQPSDARLMPDIARELCERTGSAAVLAASVANLGSQYILGLKAVNCRTGDSLAQEQTTADGKERVMKALGEAAVKLRAKLGESLGTVQKFDTPVEQATTPSLDALRAYSLGRQTLLVKGDSAAAVPFFQRAISLDPNFALAYAMLGALSERRLGAENLRKAYELRARVSEREKFFIESYYFELVTGDVVRFHCVRKHELPGFLAFQQPEARYAVKQSPLLGQPECASQGRQSTINSRRTDGLAAVLHKLRNQ